MTVFLHLLKAIIVEKVFCDLRLKKWLGYRVGCDIYNLHETKRFYFYVVSPDYKPKDLLMKIHVFIATIPDYLADVDHETFKHLRRGADLPDESCMSQELVHDNM
ncbi:hypothetical protein F2Q69_00024785 [Brassica cretica]|uniref:Coenzyme PQQ synthesis protein F-like C-terminal lobe domain-containing protein n=1 Tax=Brassica cretica TaxID=69181 RepID=A0A8S9Q4C5_BRACR|nr:hypothetical protein F2Q69_00024785 [Brassica cretica]